MDPGPRYTGFIAAGAGIALSFSFPEADLGFVAWFALVPLFAVTARASPGRAALLGGLFGLGFFGSLLIWISIVGWIAWGVLVLLQLLFAAAFTTLWAAISRASSTWLRVVGVAAAWIIVMETARAIVPIVGFTWGQLAQAQHDYLWLLRVSAWGGGWAVAGLVVAVNVLLLEAWTNRTRPPLAAVRIGAAALLLALPLLLPANSADGDSLRMAIVQGNVPRDMHPSIEKDLIILRSHQHLTEELAEQEVDLVVWPESSVAIDPDRDPVAADALTDAAGAVDAPMVVGGTSDVDADRYLVMAFQISAEGAIVDRYQKTHLVPFGEYVPARALLDGLPMLEQVPRDAIPGREEKVFHIEGRSIAPVISFEADFGPLVRGRIAAGGRLLVIATNTSTWEESWASAQHVAMSQVRAAENGVWVAHGALSGISAFIAPDGQIVDATKLWTADTLVREVRLADDITFYARTGDWLPVLCLLILVGVLVGVRRAGQVT